MLFFSAENHCRQENTLVSTKINQIVKNSLVYSYKVTHLTVLILRSGATKFSLSQTFATVEESETLKERREEETRCDSIATGPVFAGTASPPPRCCHIHIYTSSTTGMKKGENSCRENWIKERPVGSHDFCHIWTTSSQLEADGDAGPGPNQRQIGRKSGRRCQTGVTGGDGWEWMDGGEPLCNLSQHSIGGIQRERHKQTPVI